MKKFVCIGLAAFMTMAGVVLAGSEGTKQAGAKEDLPGATPAKEAQAMKPDVYVAVDGNDRNPGTKKKPFATLAKAREAVRGKIKAGLTKDLLVEIRGGTYPLTETLTFGPEDSGTEKFSITYAAAPGEKVLLSGGRTITGWKKGTNELWTAEIPEVKAGQWYPRQLFINGQRAIRARTPNVDDKTPWWIIKTATFTEPTDGAIPYYTLSVNHPIQAWKNPTDIEINMQWNDNETQKFLGSVNATNQTFTFPVPGNYKEWTTGCAVGSTQNYSCFLENALEMLDQPGEWYLDRGTGVLSYWPRPGEVLKRAAVIAPVVRNTLLSVTGTTQAPLVNLHFKGIHVEHVDRHLPPQGFSAMFCATQFTQTPAGPEHGPIEAAVEIKYAQYCSFTGGGVSHVGGCGICLRRGTAHIVIEGNELGDIGGNGIAISNVRQPPWTSWSWNPPPGPAEFTGFRVANNHVHDCGTDYIGGVGIYLGVVQKSVVSHNLIHDICYSGIQWAGDYKSAFSKDNTVEYNHIYNTMKVAVDGAGLYVCYSHAGQTVARGNLIHDTLWNTFGRGEVANGIHDMIPNHGLYLDSDSNGCRYQDNVVYRNSGGPLLFNAKKANNTWYDNLFQKDGTPPEEFIEVMKAYTGLEPAYRKAILNTEPQLCRRYALGETADTAPWSAYQYDLPKEGRGVVQIVLRSGSKEETVRMKLHDLEAGASYSFKKYSGSMKKAEQDFYEGIFFGNSDRNLARQYASALSDLPILSNVLPVPAEGTTPMSGKELMEQGLPVKLGGSPQVLWISYAK